MASRGYRWAYFKEGILNTAKGRTPVKEYDLPSIYWNINQACYGYALKVQACYG